MEILEMQNLRKEIQIKIDETARCWICGRENLLTKHHAIPQRVESPVINLEVPICKNCVHAIHHGDEITSILRKIYLK